MNRTTRITLVMALLLVSITFPTGKTEAVNRCGVEIAQKWSGAVLMQLTGCVSFTTLTNLDAYGLDCNETAIGIAISNKRATDTTFWSNGRRIVRVGCSWTQTLLFFTTSCWFTVDWTTYRTSTGAINASIGNFRANSC